MHACMHALNAYMHYAYTCMQQDGATNALHLEALRAEAERAQERMEKQLARLEKELSSCQDAKRRLEAEIVMSMHGGYAHTTSGNIPRHGSAGAFLPLSGIV
jgi:hypothetical protein